MVYGFTRQSGGHARIYSEIGQGTTVRLYLPQSHAGVADKTLEVARPVGLYEGMYLTNPLILN